MSDTIPGSRFRASALPAGSVFRYLMSLHRWLQGPVLRPLMSLQVVLCEKHEPGELPPGHALPPGTEAPAQPAQRGEQRVHAV